MVRRADLTLEWADGEYAFALRAKEIEAIEAECWNPATGKPGIGLGAIWQRVMGGDWYFTDLRNIIRHGLIGGGMGAVDASRMCKTYVDGVPISTMSPDATKPDCPLLVAQAVLAAAVIGVEDDGGGKLKPPK